MSELRKTLSMLRLELREGDMRNRVTRAIEEVKALERERDELQAKCEALETAEFVEVADMATVLKSNAELLAALEDSISALDYISKMAEGNYTPGEILCGVGWDRIDKYRALLRGGEAK